MPELAPTPSINDARGKAFAQIIARLAALDLTQILIYRIDSVPASALPFLAWQFDVASPFWQLLVPGGGVPVIDGAAPTYEYIPSVSQIFDIGTLVDLEPLTEAVSGAGSNPQSVALQRSLLKQSIALHRLRGTPWSIKTALAALGWAGATILEGEASWGGSVYPTNQKWAVNRILVALAAGQNIPLNAIKPIVAAFNFFAPARSWLDSVWFTEPALADVCDPTLDLGLGGELLNEIIFDRLAAMADGGISIVWPWPLSDSLARVPDADGSYLSAGGLEGNEAAVGVTDDGLVVGGVDEGVGL